jgi:Flp pilus assembly pilin Flp
LAWLLWHQEGQAVIEYALIAALISIAAIGTMTAVGLGVTEFFQSFVDAFHF